MILNGSAAGHDTKFSRILFNLAGAEYLNKEYSLFLIFKVLIMDNFFHQLDFESGSGML